MAEKTGIAWCDSTFNPWIGCSKIGPGCDHCYAEVQDSRKRWGGTTHWGAGVVRYRTSASTWAQPLRWNAKQQDLMRQGDAPPWRVFCASLADVFDNEAPYEWRNDLWTLVEATPHLSWLLVTKRIGNVKQFAPKSWLSLGFPKHVHLLITVCNQEEADRDIPKLLALPCKNGISYEPALGPVDWSPWLPVSPPVVHRVHHRLEWIIVGGESGSKARPFNRAWAVDTVAQCRAAGVPVFVKQMGSKIVDFDCPSYPIIVTEDRAGADPTEWPEGLRVREFPE